MLPSISVITPSYNQGQYIRQTVESVLSQDYPAVEHIVIDGLSTDDTLKVLYPYQNRLRLISERDRGQTEAINKGLKQATGDIVCWLNSDDFFLPDALYTIGRYFEQNPAALWLSGDCCIVDEKGEPIQETVRRYKRLLRALPSSVYIGMTNAICQPATFWRRSIHKQLGYLDESLRYTMDYDWWLRLNQVQAPAIVRQPLTAFRIHAQSKGGSEYEAQFAEDYRMCCRYWPNGSVRWLHRAHNELIKTVYRRIK